MLFQSLGPVHCIDLRAKPQEDHNKTMLGVMNL